MNAPRWIHRVRAKIGGYFWLPCPICGRKFGGHERPFGIVERGATGVGRCYCHWCVSELGGNVRATEEQFDIARMFDVPLLLIGADLDPEGLQS